MDHERRGVIGWAAFGLLGAGVAWWCAVPAGLLTASVVSEGGELGLGVALAVGTAGTVLQAWSWRELCRGGRHAALLALATLAGAVLLLTLAVGPLTDLVLRLDPPAPEEPWAELGAAFGVLVAGSGLAVILAGLPWLTLLARRHHRRTRRVAAAQPVASRSSSTVLAGTVTTSPAACVPGAGTPSSAEVSSRGS